MRGARLRAPRLRSAQRARLIAWLLPALFACGLSEPAPPRQTAVEALRPAPAATGVSQVPGDWRFDLRATPTRAQRALVDSDSELASRAGIDVLATGGNAVDAAVTVAFVLAAVQDGALPELVLPIFENLQDTRALAEVVRQRLERTPAVAYLVDGHGLSTWGRDLPQVRRHVEALEFMLACELARFTAGALTWRNAG